MNLTSSDTLDRRWDEKERCGREMRKTFSYIFLCLPFSFLRPKWTIISGLCEPLGCVFVPSTCMLSCIMTRRGARDLHRTSSSVIMRLRVLLFFRGSRGFIFQFAEWKRERERQKGENASSLALALPTIRYPTESCQKKYCVKILLCKLRRQKNGSKESFGEMKTNKSFV